MKSFKKLFALILVVAMFASFGIGASAAFTDAASIDNTAAVQLVSDLGVMAGYPDGTFKPDGNITRAEMAKIIVALKYGATTANSLQGTYTVTGFTDVPADHWAAAYIDICKNTGIINGVTATTFNPAGNIKTVDAVKMILSVLGYGKNGEWIGLDVKAMRTQKQQVNTKHLSNSKERFLFLLEKVRTLNKKLEAQLIAARDYEELDRYILCHLMGVKY
jgi:hypothetical protein